MQNSQTTSLVTNQIDNCRCCYNCKSKISRLQIMINELFCYMSDYLPDELQGITQTTQNKDFYYEAQDNTIFQDNGSKTQNPEINRKIKQKGKKELKDSALIKKPIKPFIVQEQQKPGKARKQYTWEQKKKLVSQVEERILTGQRIVDACRRTGISDRSYQRWKRRIEEGEMQEFECQSNEVIIEHSHI